MRVGRRSLTAEGTAILRAVHQAVDHEPLVLEDPLAWRMLEPATRWALAPTLASGRLLRPLVERRLRRFEARRPALASRRIRAQVVVRSRYCEDRLAERMSDGELDQFVVLAAGLDTFALRRTELADRLRVFEVDHPATQHAKRRRVRSARLEWPPNVELVPCDFERKTLAGALADSGFDATRPALFSWLGVSYYLTSKAIEETFRFVAAQAAGSELVLDYWRLDPPAGSTGGATRDASLRDRVVVDSVLLDRALLDSIRLSVGWQGERMVSFFTPEEMTRLLERHGLKAREHLAPEDADRRYLAERRDGLRMPTFAHLLTASR